MRLLAEAASDALERNEAARDFMARTADLKRQANYTPRLGDWLRKLLTGSLR